MSAEEFVPAFRLSQKAEKKNTAIAQTGGSHGRAAASQGGERSRGGCQRKILGRARRGGGLKHACCRELAHLHVFFKICPQALAFLFPFWTGLLHSPHYRCCHRCLLPCGCCRAQGPQGTRRALGQGEGTPGGRTTAGTASAGACTSPAPRLRQNWGTPGAQQWMHEHCPPHGARSWNGGAPAMPTLAGSSSGQVTPFLATGSCFTQSKMNKHELVLKQPQISDAIHSPIWAVAGCLWGVHGGRVCNERPGALNECQGSNNTKLPVSSRGHRQQSPHTPPWDRLQGKPCVSHQDPTCWWGAAGEVRINIPFLHRSSTFLFSSTTSSSPLVYPGKKNAPTLFKCFPGSFAHRDAALGPSSLQQKPSTGDPQSSRFPQRSTERMRQRTSTAFPHAQTQEQRALQDSYLLLQGRHQGAW